MGAGFLLPINPAIDPTYSFLYTTPMQYVGVFQDLQFLPVASNDNDDLLALCAPANELNVLRALKYILRQENLETGILLRSRKERFFFQEVMDAERYILLKYFTISPPENVLRQLKRHIMDTYLFPRRKRTRKSYKK
jgi:hypothetical protein